MKSNYIRKTIIFLIGLSLILSSIFCYLFSYNNLTIYALDFIGLGLILFASLKKESKEHIFTIKEITLIGVQGAISSLLYIFVKFNLPIFPSFLDIQVSEIPALITAFMYGPYAGSMVILIRFFVKLPFTSTAGVGEIADLFIGVILVIIVGLFYKKNRTFKGAIKGMIISMITATLLMCLINYLILIPFYLELFFKGNIDGLLAMCNMIPNINEANFMFYYLLIGVIPFNLLRFIIVFVLTILLYKRISFLFKKITC